MTTSRMQMPPLGSAHSHPAATWQRLCARLVDFVFLAVGLAIVVIPLAFATAFMPMAARMLMESSVTFMTAVASVAYFAVLESGGRRTLGKTLFGLRVYKADGSDLTLREATVRNLWTGAGVLGVIPFIGAAISSLAALLIAGTIIFGIERDDARQGWHDRLAGGTVVLARA